MTEHNATGWSAERCLAGRLVDSAAMRRSSALFAFAAFAGLLAGCSDSSTTDGPSRDTTEPAAAESAEPSSPGAYVASTTPPTDPGNVLIISLDTLRADHLQTYGYRRPTAPNIDALARAGAVFTQAIATANWTLPTHASMLTGLLPPKHRVETKNDRLNDARATLGQELTARGYRSVGYVSNPFLDARYGYARGFDEWRQPRDFVFEKAGEQAGSISGYRPPQPFVRTEDYFVDQTSPQVLDLALDFLEGHAALDDPFCLFLHFNDVHSDYIPPAPYDRSYTDGYDGALNVENYPHNESVYPGMPTEDLEYVRALYDGEISWVDEHLGRLFATLERLGFADDTLVVLTADHGEGFLERGKKEHHYGVYRELVHVPLIVRFPGRVAAGQRIESLASQVDIGPTILGLLGIDGLPEADGVDWSGVLRGDDDAAPARTEIVSRGVLYPEKGDEASLVWSVRTDDHTVHGRRKKSAKGTKFEVFDRRVDPYELAPLAVENAAWRPLIERLLAVQDEVTAAADALPMADSNDILEDDAALIERMEQLGYLKR